MILSKIVPDAGSHKGRELVSPARGVVISPGRVAGSRRSKNGRPSTPKSAPSGRAGNGQKTRLAGPKTAISAKRDLVPVFVPNGNPDRQPVPGQMYLVLRDDLLPSFLNSAIYRPRSTCDPDYRGTLQSMRRNGFDRGCPIMATLDLWIISGNTRHQIAGELGIDSVPCVFADYKRRGDEARFVSDLIRLNAQREKSNDERFREAVATIDPDANAILEYRRAKAQVRVPTMAIGEPVTRAKIAKSKRKLVQAILKAIEDLADVLPVSARSLHYRLLNDPPERHAGRRGSKYTNSPKCYKLLTDVLVRLRLSGVVAMEAISDETRNVFHPNVFGTTRAFVDEQLAELFMGYSRDLLQSQVNYHVVIAEKLTIEGTIRPVCEQFAMPFITTRGFVSLPPRAELARRFKQSGRDTLVLIGISDFDPSGQSILESFVRSMRDDFGIKSVEMVKAALTEAQVSEFRLVPRMTAKSGDSRRAGFVEQFGDDVFELEALRPRDLQDVLRRTIEGVLDTEAFNREVAADKTDCTFLAGVRKASLEAIGDVGKLIDENCDE